MRDPLQGRDLGPYRLEQRLGGGGMGVVYRAVHRTLLQPRAVKVLRPNLLEMDDRLVARFIHEARTAAGLHHPNIVQIYDIGESDDLHYIAMELLEGVSLAEVVRQGGPTPIGRALHLLRQLADALDFAHGRGVVHRDVKPANTLVSPNDKVTLVDFGIARIADGTRLTASGMMLGTPTYMAPEVITGGHAGPDADRYALGIIAFELLTGRPPFVDPQTPQVLFAQVNRPPPPPRSLRGDLPETVGQVLLQQLAKHPSERFPTATGFVAALAGTGVATPDTPPNVRSTLSSQPVTPPPPAMTPIPPWTPPLPPTYQPPASNPRGWSPAPVPPRRARGRSLAAVVGVLAVLAVVGGLIATLTFRPSQPAIPTPGVSTASGALAPAAAKPTEAPKPTTAPAAPNPPVAKPTEAPKPTTAPAAAQPPAPKPTTVPAAEKPTPPGPTVPPAAPSALSGTIKIVSSLPRTGSSKGQTDSIVNGIKMALDEVGGKVGGATIAYEDLDDATPARGAWDAGKERENADKAVADSDVMMYIGTFNSGAAKVSIPILNKAGLTMISPANTYPGLTRPGKGEPNEPNIYYPSGKRNYARVVPADDLQGAVAAAWSKQLGAQKVYVLDDTELYGHGIATVYTETARKLGLTVLVGPEGIDSKANDYRALATKIRGTSPDLVYYGGITQNNAGKLFKDLRSVLGNNVKLMGPDGIYEQAFIEDAGDAAEGVYITFGGVPASKLTGKGAEWYRAYKAKFNSEPEVYAAYGYEAMKVALDAIMQAGKKDRVAIRDAVFATREYDGVLGKWSFDANGDTSLTTMSGRQVKSGEFDDDNAVVIRAAP